MKTPFGLSNYRCSTLVGLREEFGCEEMEEMGSRRWRRWGHPLGFLSNSGTKKEWRLLQTQKAVFDRFVDLVFVLGLVVGGAP